MSPSVGTALVAPARIAGIPCRPAAGRSIRRISRFCSRTLAWPGVAVGHIEVADQHAMHGRRRDVPGLDIGRVGWGGRGGAGRRAGQDGDAVSPRHAPEHGVVADALDRNPGNLVSVVFSSGGYAKSGVVSASQSSSCGRQRTRPLMSNVAALTSSIAGGHRAGGAADLPPAEGAFRS